MLTIEQKKTVILDELTTQDCTVVMPVKYSIKLKY